MSGKRYTHGQPLLTPDVHRLIVEAVATCCPRKYAAQRAGIGESTLRLWLSRGRKEHDEIYVALLADVKKAEAEAVLTRVARIDKAAQGGAVVERNTKTVTVERKDGTVTTTTTFTEKFSTPQWVADAWVLERRHPDEFALRRDGDVKANAVRPLVVGGEADPSKL